MFDEPTAKNKKINTALRDANYLLIASTFQRFVLLQYHFRLYKKSRSMPTANDAQSAQISLSISQLRALSLLIQEVSQNSAILKKTRVNFVPRSQELEHQRV